MDLATPEPNIENPKKGQKKIDRERRKYVKEHSVSADETDRKQ